MTTSVGAERMRALLILDRVEAARTVIRYFRKARCHAGEAAKLIGCHRNTFWRMVADLDIREDLRAVEAAALSEGWHHGRVGGAGCHRDPAAVRAKAVATWARRRAEQDGDDAG